ncbi:uncharacterized protein LOC106062124 isoform X2 [Biomphalaria glabrata]|uniref:Uncharacterized protein LOC106062124 isoform X2 n=1 Tax=Biomphalaria glabrata TaxID=6526 RepID=A0A9W2ZFY9_BIOGL|nr:uncharacterized protein LOC106062124 isoform X2 [Biomphalaria glabrata]
MLGMNALCSLLVFTSILSESIVLGSSDNSGKQFVLAFPTYSTCDREVHFLVYTFEVIIDVNIFMRTMWNTVNKTNVEKNFTINREEMRVFVVYENFTLLYPDEHSIEYAKGRYLHALPRADISEKFTYVFSSKNTFYVTVIIIERRGSDPSTSAMQAVPTEGWGKVYYAVTLSNKPSIQIVTSQDTKVTITIISPKNKFYVKYNAFYYSDGGLIFLQLLAYKTFSLQACPKAEHDYGPLTGSIISGDKPIGVISGNCDGYDDSSKCSVQMYSKETVVSDMTMEMLLPEETFGYEFILYGKQWSSELGHYVVVASKENTKVQYQSIFAFTEETIPEKGKHLIIKGLSSAHGIKSNKPVAVYFIRQSSCSITSNYAGPGDAAILIVIPNELFMDVYYWLTPDSRLILKVAIEHFMCYVCKSEDVNNGLTLDGKLLPSVVGGNYSEINLSGKWQVAELKIETGYHEFYSNRSAKFGVYLYGIGEKTSYMYPAGFISTNISDIGQCTLKVQKNRRGDFEDNDCDGNVNEERNNGKDDDEDGEIDEDLIHPPPRNGSWGEWLPWWCTHCNATVKFRNRQCIKPLPIRGGHNCLGSKLDQRNGDCFSICNMVHGAWSEWQPWTCQERCQFMKRTRKCDNPAPQNNGRNCTGITEQFGMNTGCTKGCTTVSQASTTTTKKTKATIKTTNLSPVSTTQPTKITTPGLVEITTSELVELPPRNGDWGSWTQWSCPLNCKEKQMQRLRVCDSPAPEPGGLECFGPPVQLTDDNLCNAICPNDCPNYKWGLNCTKDCSNCFTPCDKNKGTCDSCKAGFHIPMKSCTYECDKYFFGYDCRGNCIDRCEGQDCVERVTGTCPAKKSYNSLYFLLLLLLIPIAILCYLPQKYKRQIEYAETDFDEFENSLLSAPVNQALKSTSSKASRRTEARTEAETINSVI